METGGLSHDCDILQIKAVHDNDKLNMYIYPSQQISKSASDVTKLTIVNGTLCYNGKKVLTTSTKGALSDFITFLKGIPNPVLVGHNIKSFYLLFLYNHLNRCQLWEVFLGIVAGFVDTLLVFKKKIP